MHIRPVQYTTSCAGTTEMRETVLSQKLKYNDM